MGCRSLSLGLLLALVATCHGQTANSLNSKFGQASVAKPKGIPVKVEKPAEVQPVEAVEVDEEPVEAAEPTKIPAEPVQPSKVVPEQKKPDAHFDAAADKAAAAAQSLEDRKAADAALKAELGMKGRERIKPAELGVGASTREAMDRVVALGEQHAAGDGKHAATGEFRTNPSALKAAEKAKARAREAKVWVDEKLTQSKTMRDGLGELSERSREQFKRQTEEYRNVVKTHKQTKEGLKARLTGPGLTGPDAANHSEELR